jgi:hypothetical protein
MQQPKRKPWTGGRTPVRKLLIATLALLALPSAAGAATKTYNVERLHISISGFGEQLDSGRGWLFMEDVSGVRSTVRMVLITDLGTVLFPCIIQTAGSKNIVNVGPFAQRATGSLASVPAAARLNCRQITSLTVNCAYEGVPAPESRSHIIVTGHKGTYRSPQTDAPSSYSITGHRDEVTFCDVTINGSLFREQHAILTRLRSSHTSTEAAPPYVDFWRDPTGWINTDDIAFPF